MVFLGREPPNVAEQQFPRRHAQFPPQCGAATLVLHGKAGGVNAVGQHREGAVPKQHFARLLAAREPVGQARVKPAAHQPVEPPN